LKLHEDMTWLSDHA